MVGKYINYFHLNAFLKTFLKTGLQCSKLGLDVQLYCISISIIDEPYSIGKL